MDINKILVKRQKKNQTRKIEELAKKLEKKALFSWTGTAGTWLKIKALRDRK